MGVSFLMFLHVQIQVYAGTAAALPCSFESLSATVNYSLYHHQQRWLIVIQENSFCEKKLAGVVLFFMQKSNIEY